MRMIQRYSHLSVDSLRESISVLNGPAGARKGAQTTAVGVVDAT